ncbi:Protein PHLOEM PROTEIN 2-LIKE like [Melia azedarach]|uniref:Protein PHLOEM PROTEIN 2-LIKE like n=1 Tax=Melia azedarach TaxID=155640 RepID=A0ACC1WVU6_MELAZ|nr:Protein PHLOEM PROTEIN 2-LIKE like [Melia azedarach]
MILTQRTQRKKLKFRVFVTRGLEDHSIMLFAKDMTIIWSDNSQYWKWISVKKPSGATVDAAELLDVCWLEIRARIDTKKLSPGIPYQAGFVVMMKGHAYGWENPVKLGLLFPNGSKKEVHFDLKEIKQRNEWVEIRIGESFTLPKSGGELEISMCGSEGLYWKKGLVIKAVFIRPKNN